MILSMFEARLCCVKSFHRKKKKEWKEKVKRGKTKKGEERKPMIGRGARKDQWEWFLSQ